jgi:multiple sugar transport system ATP-binding protein
VLLGPLGLRQDHDHAHDRGARGATAGDILIGGRRVNDLDPKDRDIAMVFQSYALYPNLTSTRTSASR